MNQSKVQILFEFLTAGTTNSKQKVFGLGNAYSSLESKIGVVNAMRSKEFKATRNAGLQAEKMAGKLQNSTDMYAANNAAISSNRKDMRTVIDRYTDVARASDEVSEAEQEAAKTYSKRRETVQNAIASNRVLKKEIIQQSRALGNQERVLNARSKTMNDELRSEQKLINNKEKLRVLGKGLLKEDGLHAKKVQELSKLENNLVSARTDGALTPKAYSTQMKKVGGMRLSEELKRITAQENPLIKTQQSVNEKMRAFAHYTGLGNKLTSEQTKELSALQKEHKKLGAGQNKGILKAAKWAVMWTVLYGIMRTVTNTIKKVTQTIANNELMMARIGTVTRGTAKVHRKALTQMREDSWRYAIDTGRNVTNVMESYYHLGSAGLSAAEQLSGMEHIQNLTMGTFGKTQEVARLVAGAYNVFGKEIEHVTGASEKMKYISDVLAYTYSRQQVELSEIASAMTIVGSAAGLIDISFSELVGTIGELNTGLLRGTRSGTALANSMFQIARNGDRLKEQLGIAFDTTKPLNYTDIIGKLANRLGEGKISMEDFRSLIDIFGIRGARAAAMLTKRFQAWKETVDTTHQTFENFAEYMQTQVTNTLPQQFKRLGNSILKAFMPSEVSTKAWTRWLTKLNDNLQTGMGRLKDEGGYEQSLHFLVTELRTAANKVKAMRPDFEILGTTKDREIIAASLRRENVDLLSFSKAINQLYNDRTVSLESEYKTRKAFVQTESDLIILESQLKEKYAISNKEILRLILNAEELLKTTKDLDPATQKFLETIRNVKTETDAELEALRGILDVNGGISKKMKLIIQNKMSSYRLSQEELKGYHEIEQIEGKIIDNLNKMGIARGQALTSDAKRLITNKKIVDAITKEGSSFQDVVNLVREELRLLSRSTFTAKEIETIAGLMVDRKAKINQYNKSESTLLKEHSHELKNGLFYLSEHEKHANNIEFINKKSLGHRKKSREVLEEELRYQKLISDEIQSTAEEYRNNIVDAITEGIDEFQRFETVAVNVFSTIGKSIRTQMLEQITDMALAPTLEGLSTQVMSTTQFSGKDIKTDLAEGALYLRKAGNQIKMDGFSASEKLRLDFRKSSDNIKEAGKIAGILMSKSFRSLTPVMGGGIAVGFRRAFNNDVDMMGASLGAAFGTVAGDYLNKILGVGFSPMGSLIRLGASILGSLFGANQKLSKQPTKSDAEKFEKAVTSTLNPVASELQIVNRNLVDLKTNVDPYIMPESFYFRSLPRFHDGGAVPGSIGTEVPIMAMGGEKMGGGNTSIIIENISVGSDAQKEDVIHALEEYFSSHNNRGFTG